MLYSAQSTTILFLFEGNPIFDTPAVKSCQAEGTGVSSSKVIWIFPSVLGFSPNSFVSPGKSVKIIED